ncbi:glycerol-3-phosphate cytidylyltransferase [Solimonas fluminis]|uniref:Glycerol-3-phosphate cytidylyltransferase n=1 Tax=Solimonas fluminis TaxID=2086571 RepID=A0A2S5TFH6_9GAMM|nr:adenylyltransferase/cytidyltransferase family protein [Solimonas fluminis]PPE73657.1 glycerol-3-phosphate cytidylyltransferase [Solimonas fluminis]
MKKVGYTTGVWDLFHVGHLNLLRRARLECDYLIVGVTTDELSEAGKGRTPIIPFAERLSIIEGLRWVDSVVPQVNYDKWEAWNNFKFNVMFVGDDWRNSARWNGLEAKFQEVGVDIVYLPYTTHTSSSKLRGILDRFEQADGR